MTNSSRSRKPTWTSWLSDIALYTACTFFAQAVLERGLKPMALRAYTQWRARVHDAASSAKARQEGVVAVNVKVTLADIEEAARVYYGRVEDDDAATFQMASGFFATVLEDGRVTLWSSDPTSFGGYELTVDDATPEGGKGKPKKLYGKVIFSVAAATAVEE